MKILVVTQYFWPEDFRINDICQGLQSEGNEVEILTGLPNYPEGTIYEGYSFWQRGAVEYEGMPLHRCFLIGRGKKNPLKLLLNYLSFMIAALFHLPKLAKKKFERIFVFQVSPITSGVPAFILGKWKKIPTSIYVQDLWPETFYSIIPLSNPLMQKLFKKLCYWIYDQFDQILIASEGYRDLLIAGGIADEKIEYLPQWAEDVYSESQDHVEVEFKKNDDYFTVTFAGNIGKAQSVETIIEAAKLAQNHPHIQWKILGDGSEFAAIQQLVQQYQLEATVQLLGRKPSTEMPAYFAQSDALLVTLKDSDILRITLPAKVQSYMAATKPIIGAISGAGMKAIEKSQCGFVGEAEDAQQLYENVLKMAQLADYELNLLAENGRNYFNTHFQRQMLLENLNTFLATNQRR